MTTVQTQTKSGPTTAAGPPTSVTEPLERLLLAVGQVSKTAQRGATVANASASTPDWQIIALLSSFALCIVQFFKL